MCHFTFAAKQFGQELFAECLWLHKYINKQERCSNRPTNVELKFPMIVLFIQYLIQTKIHKEKFEKVEFKFW